MDRVAIDVSGDPHVDLEHEAALMLMREQRFVWGCWLASRRSNPREERRPDGATPRAGRFSARMRAEAHVSYSASPSPYRRPLLRTNDRPTCRTRKRRAMAEQMGEGRGDERGRRFQWRTRSHQSWTSPRTARSAS